MSLNKLNEIRPPLDQNGVASGIANYHIQKRRPGMTPLAHLTPTPRVTNKQILEQFNFNNGYKYKTQENFKVGINKAQKAQQRADQDYQNVEVYGPDTTQLGLFKTSKMDELSEGKLSQLYRYVEKIKALQITEEQTQELIGEVMQKFNVPIERRFPKIIDPDSGW